MTDPTPNTGPTETPSTAIELDATEPDLTEPDDTGPDATEPVPVNRGVNWRRVLAYGILPGLVLILALAAAFLKYVDSSVRVDDEVRAETLQAAKDSTIALLSYTPDKVDQQLGNARSLLTGDFRDSYTTLTNDVVIPGAKQKQISAVATVPAAASVSAEPNRAVVLVFVNQTVVVGSDAPTDTASSVRVTLDRVGGRWLVSGFDPV